MHSTQDTPIKMTHDQLIERARRLVPLLEETARDAEDARRPLDHVIAAVAESGLFSMMVPECYGGHEADIDTFFDVVLILSEADTSMGWLIGFYIEHNWWFCHYPKAFQQALFSEKPYALAPAALSVGGGKAKVAEGGYRLTGQWQWGTGIVHAEWVIAGALVQQEDGSSGTPMFFALPRAQTEMIDTWYMAGMCGTGSNDFKIDDVFVPEAQAVSFLDMASGSSGIKEMHPSPLYATPMLTLLSLAGSLPILGTAKRCVREYIEQVQKKTNATTGVQYSADPARQVIAGQASLTVEAAELVLRGVLAELIAHRNGDADREMRAGWLARVAHAVVMCRGAVNQLCEVSGAGANNLSNPLQRILRDVNTASCHVIFDRESRYKDYGRTLVGLEAASPLL